MKTLLFGLSFVGALGFPFVSSAATYHYLDLSGAIRDVEAVNSAAALTYIYASGDALHSGVALDMGVLEEGDDFGNDYQYRTVTGAVKTVHAATYDAARLLATDRDPSSGFLLIP